MSKYNYDTTLARIAGNIAAGLVQPDDDPSRDAEIRDRACNLAEGIVQWTQGHKILSQRDAIQALVQELWEAIHDGGDYEASPWAAKLRELLR